MRERPILFSGPMVRAILDGTKTQTRRVVGLDTLQPSTTSGYEWTFRGKAPVRSIAQQKRAAGGCWQDLTAGQFLALCPYGEPGDRLWVKETYALHHAWDAHPPSAGGAASKRVWHRADAPDAIDGRGRWRQSIHMPRWASRLTLGVTSVRVERLHDITEDDARAEGVEPSYGKGWDGQRAQILSARDGFAHLWTSINGSESWVANPFVWVVCFKRVEVPRG